MALTRSAGISSRTYLSYPNAPPFRSSRHSQTLSLLALTPTRFPQHTVKTSETPRVGNGLEYDGTDDQHMQSTLDTRMRGRIKDRLLYQPHSTSKWHMAATGNQTLAQNRPNGGPRKQVARGPMTSKQRHIAYMQCSTPSKRARSVESKSCSALLADQPRSCFS